MDVLDLFAGPGGWSVALRMLDASEAGVEWEWDPVRTARAAGHPRDHGDVRYVAARLHQYHGVIASPPCQTFSQAGLGEGTGAIRDLVNAAELVADGLSPADAMSWTSAPPVVDMAPLGFEYEVPVLGDERSALVLEPLRVIRDVRPTWVALEQVPQVLPIWHAIARLLWRMGYHTDVGIVSAECYGIPQTRRRAVLVANRTGPVFLPFPTHSRYHQKHPDRIDDGTLPWVSMADALGWGMTDRPYLTVATGTAAGGTDPQVLGGSGARRAVQRELESGRWVDRFTPAGRSVVEGLQPRTLDRPAHTITGAGSAMWLDRFNDQSGTEYDPLWPGSRPATTVAGRGIVANPGSNGNRFNGSTKSRNDGVRVSVAEAGVLQGFDRTYPWCGTESSQYQQVGDAVPPALALAIIRAAMGEPRG